MNFIILFLILINKVIGDVSLTAPKTGQTYSGSSGSVTFDLKWVDSTDDSDNDFSLSKAEKYTISLCTGPTSSIDCFVTLLEPTEITTKDYSVDFKSSVADDGYYFIQVYTTYKEGYTIHYSNRFELTDMTGSTKTLTVANTYTGSAPPPQTSGAAATSINSKSFSITYTLQTGKTRFAPMQLQPGSKVTASSWSRKFPTSAVTYYTSPSPSPVCLSTITPGWSYTISSVANWADPAPTPSIKYDPSDRVTKASLSSASKSKRWLD